ncbi:MAG TPA: gas vesicle protein [Propionibacteriaceae bacterium]|nr:gas vesicle protein [Propionibacteriaceae bacterium]
MSIDYVGNQDDIALVDLIDRLIDGGVVLTGDILLSIADVDLVYLGVRLVLAPAHRVHVPSLGLGPPSGNEP